MQLFSCVQMNICIIFSLSQSGSNILGLLLFSDFPLVSFSHSEILGKISLHLQTVKSLCLSIGGSISSLFFPLEPRSGPDSRPIQRAQLGSAYPCVIKQVEEGGEQASPVGAVGTQHSIQEAVEGLELALI